MGTWGPGTFENDGASDWLFDLEEAEDASFLLKPLHSAARARGTVDLDDALESLAASEVLTASRSARLARIPRFAHVSIRRIGLVAKDADLDLAVKAVQKIRENSELRDSWEESGNLAGWLKAVDRVLAGIAKARQIPLIIRETKVRPKRETLAELIIRVDETKDPALRQQLREKLSNLKNPNKPVSGKGLNRMPPLHFVASRGLLEEARILLARGADVDSHPPPMARPVGFAIENNHLKMVQLLIDAGADRGYAINYAAQSKGVGILKNLLQTKADREMRYVNGGTWLHTAARGGSLGALRFLMTQGIDIDATDDFGDTALHEAVGYCHHATAKALLEAGARTNIKNKKGKTVFDEAEEVRDLEPKVWKLLQDAR